MNSGIVYSRLAKTGALLYSGRLGAMGYYYASPVAADQKIFIASEEGVVVVLEAGDQSMCWPETSSTERSGHAGDCRRKDLCADRQSLVRVRKLPGR